MSVKSTLRDPKVVLLGDSASGKTCLAIRYIHGEFIKQSETVGASIHAKEVVIDGKKFKIGLWDTAGSERFRSMMPMYYHGSDVALLCYDVNDSSAFERVVYWKRQLDEHEPSCTVFVVGTMVDLLSDTNEPLLKEREDRFAAEFEVDGSRFYRTSAVTGAGVNELFQAIAEYCFANVKDLKLYTDDNNKPDEEANQGKKCCVIQ